jgi:hypothetical protein
MNYAFPDIDPNTVGQTLKVPVPLSRYLEESFASAEHDTVLNSLNRMSEFSAAQSDESSPILDTATANTQWAVGDLKFDEPVRESVARVMNRRKRDEMDRNFFLAQGSSTGRFIPGMATSLLGAVSNPLDLGLMFVPFVGEEAVAAKATTVVGKIAARRLVTRETLQGLVPAAPRLTESVINGVVGQTMFEIPNIIASRQDQADYGPKQAAFNILAGGGFAAAMHGAGMLLSKLGRGTREEMTRQALNQFLKDENIKVDNFVKLDEEAIWAKIRFDQDSTLQKAYDSIVMDDIAKAVREQYGEKIASPAVRMADGSVHTGPGHEVITEKLFAERGENYHLDEEGFVTDKGRFIGRDEAGKLVGLPDRGYNHILWASDKLLTEQISTANPDQLGAAEQNRYYQLLEENPQRSKVAALKIIMVERERQRDRYLMAQPHIQELVERERQTAVARFMDEERTKFEQQKQGRFDQLKQQEIDRQIAEGRVLKPEEIQKATPAREHDGSQDADLDKDIEGLKKDLKIEEITTQRKQTDPIEESPENIWYHGEKKGDQFPLNKRNVVFLADSPEAADAYGKVSKYQVTAKKTASEDDVWRVLQEIYPGVTPDTYQPFSKATFKAVTAVEDAGDIPVGSRAGGSALGYLAYSSKLHEALKKEGFDSFRFFEREDDPLNPNPNHHTLVVFSVKDTLQLFSSKPHSGGELPTAGAPVSHRDYSTKQEAVDFLNKEYRSFLYHEGQGGGENFKLSQVTKTQNDLVVVKPQTEAINAAVDCILKKII